MPPLQDDPGPLVIKFSFFMFGLCRYWMLVRKSLK